MRSLQHDSTVCNALVITRMRIISKRMQKTVLEKLDICTQHKTMLSAEHRMQQQVSMSSHWRHLQSWPFNFSTMIESSAKITNTSEAIRGRILYLLQIFNSHYTRIIACWQVHYWIRCTDPALFNCTLCSLELPRGNVSSWRCVLLSAPKLRDTSAVTEKSIQ